MFQTYTNKIPNLSHLKVFGSLIYVKTPQIEDDKLNTTHIATGIFLHYNTTDRAITYKNTITKH